MLYMDYKIVVGFFPDGSRVRLGGKKSLSGGRTACVKMEIYETVMRIVEFWS